MAAAATGRNPLVRWPPPERERERERIRVGCRARKGRRELLAVEIEPMKRPTFGSFKYLGPRATSIEVINIFMMY
jgi:hypothetical protein